MSSLRSGDWSSISGRLIQLIGTSWAWQRPADGWPVRQSRPLLAVGSRREHLFTRRASRAHEELIAAELMAAEVAAVMHPGGVEGRPGWLEGILTTLRWAWTGSAKVPLEMPSTSTG